jgi:hypothetical protein
MASAGSGRAHVYTFAAGPRLRNMVVGSFLVQTLLVMIHVGCSKHNGLRMGPESRAVGEFQAVARVTKDGRIPRVDQGTVADCSPNLLTVITELLPLASSVLRIARRLLRPTVLLSDGHAKRVSVDVHPILVAHNARRSI